MFLNHLMVQNCPKTIFVKRALNFFSKSAVNWRKLRSEKVTSYLVRILSNSIFEMGLGYSRLGYTVWGDRNTLAKPVSVTNILRSGKFWIILFLDHHILRFYKGKRTLAKILYYDFGNLDNFAKKTSIYYVIYASPIL